MRWQRRRPSQEHHARVRRREGLHRALERVTREFHFERSAPFGPSAIRTPKVGLDIGARVARVEVGPEALAHFSEQSGSRVRLASRLVGWDVRIVPHDDN